MVIVEIDLAGVVIIVIIVVVVDVRVLMFEIFIAKSSVFEMFNKYSSNVQRFLLK